MKTSLDEMVVFVEIVDCGGFKKAAQSTGLGTATISRKLAQLEKSLGVRLISRTTRSIKLTEYGEAFYGPCKKMVEFANLAENAVKQAKQQQSNRHKNQERWRDNAYAF